MFDQVSASGGRQSDAVERGFVVSKGGDDPRFVA